jgi:hypothetical protein
MEPPMLLPPYSVLSTHSTHELSSLTHHASASHSHPPPIPTQDVDDRVTVKVSIPARDHRVFFVNTGAEIRRITDEWNVSIKIPDRRQAAPDRRGGGAKDNTKDNAKGGSRGKKPKADAAAVVPVDEVVVTPDAADVDGDAAGADAATTEDAATADDAAAAATDAGTDAEGVDAAAPKADAKGASKARVDPDIITIIGTPANCAGAEAALRDMLPIEETIQIDPSLHRFVIGKGGEAVRKFMAEYNVNVNFGKTNDPSVRVRGDKAKVILGLHLMCVHCLCFFSLRQSCLF